jgi:hypothetical protein
MLLSELYEDVSMAQLHDVEKFADKLWGKLGIDIKFTHHFMQRLNDERNGKPISSAELIRLFKKEYAENGTDIKDIDGEREAILKDLFTDINLPFVMKDTRSGTAMVAKTIMRKKDFKSSSKAFTIDK